MAHGTLIMSIPLIWANVHWLVQHNANGWPCVHWETIGQPSEYLQGTLEHQWKNLFETALHWNATRETDYCSPH